MLTPRAHTLVVIPCAAGKLDAPALALELYNAPNFRYMLHAARVTAAADAAAFGHHTKVMILSAKHGLVDLGDVLAPYDVRMGDAEAITPEALAAQLVALAPETVIGMLPNGYKRTMDAAVRLVNDMDEPAPWIEFLDVFEGGTTRAHGIGWQRGIAAALVRTETPAGTEPAA